MAMFNEMRIPEERKEVYEISMNGYTPDQISERIKIIRDIITNDKDIVVEVDPEEYTYQVVRVRCTWTTFKELIFRFDLTMIKLWV